MLPIWINSTPLLGKDGRKLNAAPRGDNAFGEEWKKKAQAVIETKPISHPTCAPTVFLSLSTPRMGCYLLALGPSARKHVDGASPSKRSALLGWLERTRNSPTAPQYLQR